METLGAFRGLEPSGSLPLASPASLPLGLVCNEERKMTAGSGRRLSVLLPQSGPLGRCLKILLESETWASPEYSLRWKLKATKCGCSVFQLAPSAPRIDANGTGSSLIPWKTPAVQEPGVSIERLVTKEGEPWVHGERAYDKHTGRVCQTGLTQQMQTVDTLRTPKQGEGMGRYSRVNGKDYPALHDQVKSAWPTPTSRDHKGATQTPEQMDYVPNILQAGIGPMPSTCLARTEKFAVRLMTLSAWLMGYTAAYLAHWATASSRKSRPKSSQP
jgi:hypothetical protein